MNNYYPFHNHLAWLSSSFPDKITNSRFGTQNHFSLDCGLRTWNTVFHGHDCRHHTFLSIWSLSLTDMVLHHSTQPMLWRSVEGKNIITTIKFISDGKRKKEAGMCISHWLVANLSYVCYDAPAATTSIGKWSAVSVDPSLIEFPIINVFQKLYGGGIWEASPAVS